MPKPNSNFEAALLAAEVFGPVFPCFGSGQRQGQPKFTGWSCLATRDRQSLAEWWRDDPHALPALVTGSPSGVTVIDVANAHGRIDPACLRAIAALPATFTVSPGPEHLQFYLNSSRNSRTGATAETPPKGVRIFGDGTYVIAPGSVASGCGTEYRVLIDAGLAELPPRWAFRSEPATKFEPSRAGSALLRCARQVADAAGDRNAALTSATEALAPFVRLDLLGESEIRATLRAAYFGGGRSDAASDGAFEQQFRSALKRGWSFNPGERGRAGSEPGAGGAPADVAQAADKPASIYSLRSARAANRGPAAKAK